MESRQITHLRFSKGSFNKYLLLQNLRGKAINQVLTIQGELTETLHSLF